MGIVLYRWFQGHHDHPSQDSCTLASSRFPSVLAVEIPLSWRPTEDRCGTARADPADERRKFLVGSDIGQIMSKHNRAGQRTGDGPDDPGRRTIGVPAEQHCPLLGMTQSRPAGYFTFSVRDFRRTFIRSGSTLPNQTAWSM